MLGTATQEKGLELAVPGTAHALHVSIRRKSFEDGNFAPSKRRRWTPYIVTALICTACVGLYVHSRAGRAGDRTIEVLVPEVEQVEEQGSSRGTLVADGTFLADLGPAADEAYHLGPVDPDE